MPGKEKLRDETTQSNNSLFPIPSASGVTDDRAMSRREFR